MIQKDVVKLNELTTILKEIEYLKYTLDGTLYWDKITNMPNGGLYYRTEVMSYLAGELYKKLSSNKLFKLVEYFDINYKNDFKISSMIRKIKRNYIYVNSIPKNTYREYINHISISESIWQEAREKNDLSLYLPYLEKTVEYFKKFANYWGYKKSTYDALLQYYEEGVDVETLDKYICQLKQLVIGIIKDKKDVESNLPKIRLSIDKQKQLSEELLKLIGFDFSHGCLSESIHPTTLSCSPKDVRIVTHYCEDDIFVGIYNTLHEGGKGLYEQDIDYNLIGTLLAEVASFSLEEAEAKIYENIIGKSKKFCELLLSKIAKYSPNTKDITVEDLYSEINHINPSLIRIEADELTSVLHIIIRYEIERDLIENNINVKEIENIWNQKYEEYLGVKPNTVKEGILQDIHWAIGYFGYFPSYLFANIYSTQITSIMSKELEGIIENINNENLVKIHNWLKKNIHQNGAIYTPQELIKKISNEEIKLDYYIKYLKNKYC